MDKINEQSDTKLFNGLLAVIGLSFIFPEYIAPLFVFIYYIFFLVHFKRTKRNAKMGNLGKAFLVYMMYMVVSAIWSNTHILSGLIGLLWMGCFLFYLEIANIVNTKEKLKNAITALNISSGVIGLIGILQYVTYNLYEHTSWWKFLVANPLYYNFDEWVFNLFPFDIVNYVFEMRASSTFDNPLILATFLVITTPFCAFSSLYFKHSKNRKISRICFIASLVGLLCTSSRGAYIAVALSIITLLFSNKKIFKKLLPFIFILAVGIPLTIALRFKNTAGGEDFLASDSNRFQIWELCAKLFKEHWLVGLGAGTENIHQEIINQLDLNRTHAHNLFLEVATEGGIIGIIMVAVIIGIFAKNIIKLYSLKNKAYRPYAVLYTSSIIGFIVMSLYEHTLQSPKEMMIFFVLLGFSEATLRMAEDKIQLADDEKGSFEEFTEQDYINDKEEVTSK